MTFNSQLTLILAVVALTQTAQAFQVTSNHAGLSQAVRHRASDASRVAFVTASDGDTAEISTMEKVAYEILTDLHNSKFSFRIVVIGSNGAILETTNVLGPTFKVGQSPKTGANLATLATEDKSFELHLMLAKIGTVVFDTKESDGKILRILRLMANEDTAKPVCSLIMASDNDEKAASEWFESMKEKYHSNA